MGLRKINFGHYQSHFVAQLVQPVHQELMEKMARQRVQQLVYQDLLALKVIPEQQAHRDRKAIPEQQARRGLKVLPGHRLS